MLWVFAIHVFGVLTFSVSLISASPGALVAIPNSKSKSVVSSTSSTAPNKTPIFIFAGDSTICRTATLGPNDEASPCASVGGDTINGWGQGFLNTFNGQINSQSAGFGSANNTLGVYRNTRAWMEIGNAIGNIVAYLPLDNLYILLAIGHLDQKSPKAKASFSTDLNGAITDIFQYSCYPILVTPLTNRAFQNGHVIEDLKDITQDTIAVAKSRDCPVIDLNAASTIYINSIGEEAAAKYDPLPSDKTNLTADGGNVFGRMVNDLLVEAFPELVQYTIPDPMLSAQLKNGIPV